MAHSIALVDDDRNILTSVSILLEAEGYQVQTYKDGEEGLKGIMANTPDLVVLDIKMPRMDGMEMLAALRKDNQVPVIFLTSKDDEIDELLGLRMGADDFIRKPFSQRLLLERIRVLIRRQDALKQATRGDDSQNDVIQRGPLTLDATRHLCAWKKQHVNLTVTEFLIVQSLARHLGHVKTRDQLIDAAYGEHIYVDDRTIDSHIKRVRKKFKQVDDEFNQIETLYGIGYRYSQTPDA